jgi:hypothetical protein
VWTRRDPAEVTGEDGELRRGVASCVHQKYPRMANASEALRVRVPRENGGGEKLMSVLRQDSHCHDQHASSTIRARFLDHSPHQLSLRRREGAQDLPVRAAADRADTL